MNCESMITRVYSRCDATFERCGGTWAHLSWLISRKISLTQKELIYGVLDLTLIPSRPRNRNSEKLKRSSPAAFVSSLRAVGALGDYRQESLTLYEDTYFQNEEEFSIGDLLHLRLIGRISSLIIWSSHWTIYDKPNFGGKWICLQSTPTLEYAPSFVQDTTELDPIVPVVPLPQFVKDAIPRK